MIGFARRRRLVLLAAVSLVVGGCELSTQPGPVVEDSEFQRELQSSDWVLVKFGASWCGPCQMLDGELDKLADRGRMRARVVKVDTDSNPEIASQYNVSGIPHMIIFHKGQLVDQHVGYRSVEEIESWVGSLSGVTLRAPGMHENPFVTGT